MKKLLVLMSIAMLLMANAVMAKETGTYTAPVLDVKTETVTYEGHTYIKGANAVVGGLYMCIYRSEKNGAVMAGSLCLTCTPFSWLVVRDTIDLYCDNNWLLMDTSCDGVFDTKYIGEETRYQNAPRCILDQMGILE